MKEKTREEIEQDLSDVLDALEDMWTQYCPPPHYHEYMSAGERTEVLLQRLRPDFPLYRK